MKTKTMMPLILIVFASLSTSEINAQAQSKTSIFIGHSLVNFNMPHYFDALAEDGGHTSDHYVQIINGAPLQVNWENSSTAQGTDARATVPAGNYNVMVMTERVPLAGTYQWHNSPLFAGNFYDLAMTANSATQVYMYETWHCVASGTPAGCFSDPFDDLDWRSRLTSDLDMWMEIVDSVNLMYSHTQEMLLIPGGQGMAELYDEIQAGTVPGLSSINEVFEDDIHLNVIGNYFIALVHYATIFKESPVGLTNQIYDEWNNLLTGSISEALATRLQEIAWEAVINCPYSGVISNTASINEINPISDVITIDSHPNPTKDQINFSIQTNVQVTNIMGKNIASKQNIRSFDLSNQPRGVYFLTFFNNNGQVIQRSKIVKE